MGVGEIVVNSIVRDGTRDGYDLESVRAIASAVRIPVIASGGAGCLDDFRSAIVQAGASAVTAGSLFVFHGKHRAVLVNYPDQETLSTLFRMN